jgi:hypothetical protein
LENRGNKAGRQGNNMEGTGGEMKELCFLCERSEITIKDFWRKPVHICDACNDLIKLAQAEGWVVK